MTAPVQTIMVPLDGSELAEQAIPLATALARASGATLHLTRVFVPYVEHANIPAMIASNAEFERRLEAEAAEYLRSVGERLEKELPGQLRCDPLRTRPIGSPYSETVAVVDRLRLAAAELSPDLIVMATHARGGLGRAWMGSVADALIRRISVPTLLVHPREPAAPPASVFHHILVPLDGSSLAEQSLELAARLASLGDARITLLMVVIPQLAITRPSSVMQFNIEQLQQRESEAGSYLGTVADRLRSKVKALDTAVVVAENPARAILEWAAQNGVDLVAMATHGRSGFRRFMLGSVADKVVRGAPIPVALTRPDESAPAEVRS